MTNIKSAMIQSMANKYYGKDKWSVERISKIRSTIIEIDLFESLRDIFYFYLEIAHTSEGQNVIEFNNPGTHKNLPSLDHLNHLEPDNKSVWIPLIHELALLEGVPKDYEEYFYNILTDNTSFEKITEAVISKKVEIINYSTQQILLWSRAISYCRIIDYH